VIVLTLQPGVKGGIFSSELEARLTFDNIVKLISDLTGSQLSSNKNGRAFFLNGDRVGWYECVNPVCYVPKSHLVKEQI
jgi:hypothetical protein